MEKFFLPKRPWYKPGRLAWLGTFFNSLGLIPLGIAKAAQQLLTLHPIRALSTLLLTSAGSISLATISLLSTIITPKIGGWIIRKSLLPSTYKKTLDQTPYNQETISYPYHDVTINLIKTPKGSVEQICITPHVSSDKYTFHLCGNGDFFQRQLTHLIPYKVDKDEKTVFSPYQSKLATSRNIIGLNYPGTNPARRDAYSLHSSNDLLNAILFQIYETIDTLQSVHHWNDLELKTHLPKYISLVGHSLGGAVALQVAAHFKEKHDIELPIFVDRSFSSLKDVIAKHIQYFLSTPTWFGKPLSSLLLYAGGGWEIDSVEACKKLNPQQVKYINLGLSFDGTPIRSNTPLTFTERLVNFFLGKKKDADPMILDGATLTDGIEEAVRQLEKTSENKADSSTKIFATLKTLADQQHRVYYASSRNYDPHCCPLSHLSISPPEIKKDDAESKEIAIEIKDERSQKKDVTPTAQDFFELMTLR